MTTDLKTLQQNSYKPNPERFKKNLWPRGLSKEYKVCAVYEKESV